MRPNKIQLVVLIVLLVLLPVFAALPPQKMSPVPKAVVIPPPVYTHARVTWPADTNAPENGCGLWYEIWEWKDPDCYYIPELSTIYEYCTFTNSITMPLFRPELTTLHYFQLYDTNGAPIGWSSNVYSGTAFMVVSVGAWNYRHTNAGPVTITKVL